VRSPPKHVAFVVPADNFLEQWPSRLRRAGTTVSRTAASLRPLEMHEFPTQRVGRSGTHSFAAARRDRVDHKGVLGTRRESTHREGARDAGTAGGWGMEVIDAMSFPVVRSNEGTAFYFVERLWIVME
jgi:hypothetical protein